MSEAEMEEASLKRASITLNPRRTVGVIILSPPRVLVQWVVFYPFAESVLFFIASNPVGARLHFITLVITKFLGAVET